MTNIVSTRDVTTDFGRWFILSTATWCIFVKTNGPRAWLRDMKLWNLTCLRRMTQGKPLGYDDPNGGWVSTEKGSGLLRIHWFYRSIIYIPYTVHTYYVLTIHSYDILCGIDVFWLWQGRQLRPMTNTIFGTSGKITEAHQDPNYRMCNLSFSNLDYWASAILRHSIQHSFTQHFR